jgi:hypothetical protein
MIVRQVSKTWKKLGDEVFILDGKNELTHSLNETAAWFWMILEQQSDYEKILDIMVDTYNVTREDAQNDLNNLIDELKTKGLITIDG